MTDKVRLVLYSDASYSHCARIAVTLESGECVLAEEVSVEKLPRSISGSPSMKAEFLAFQKAITFASLLRKTVFKEPSLPMELIVYTDVQSFCQLGIGVEHAVKLDNFANNLGINLKATYRKSGLNLADVHTKADKFKPVEQTTKLTLEHVQKELTVISTEKSQYDSKLSKHLLMKEMEFQKERDKVKKGMVKQLLKMVQGTFSVMGIEYAGETTIGGKLDELIEFYRL